ncbi:MAG: MFS transporter [Gemmatimonadota bacterium]
MLVTLLLASSLTVLAGAIIAPALPTMAEHFHDTPGVDLLVRLVLTMPALFIVVGAPLAGWIADFRGRRGLLIGSVLAYAVTGTAGAFLPSVGAILVSRGLLGLAVAGVMTAVTALLADYYGGADRARVMGFQAAFMGLGGLVFTGLGGLLAGVDWRGPFLVYLLALGVLPLTIRTLWEPLKEKDSPPERNVGSQPGPQLGTGRWDSTDFPWRVVAPVYGVAFIMQMAFYTIPVQFPFHLAAVTGGGPELAGLAIGTTSLFFSLASLASARLNEGVGYGTVIGRGFLVGAVGFAGVGLAASPLTMFPSLAVAGIGIGLVLPAMMVWLTTAVAPRLRGRALGGLTTAVFLGQFVSPLASQPFLVRVGSEGVYLGVAGLLVLVALLLTLLVNGRRRIRRKNSPSSFASPPSGSSAP